jgi:hypothetical protein
MKPIKGSDTLQIPITFDNGGGGRSTQTGKPLWVFFTVLFWVISSIIVFVASETLWQWIYPFLSFFLLSYIVRFLIIRERYFKAKRKELMDNDYMFNHSIFWNIYEVGNKYPHIVQFGSGMKGIFIALDKDVIVGKDKDHDYYHHEAIANAYQQMEKRGIECIHIDYMDTVGKDSRMQSLFQQASKTENIDLRRVMVKVYDHIEYTMNKSYASYDVYCFYSGGRDDLFWDELQVVLDYFRQANYIRARALNRDDIAILVKSIMNIDEFSVNRANDNLFKELNQVEHIRAIWTEKDGSREVLNKTLEEVAEVKRVQQAEKKLKKSKIGKKGLFKKKKEEEDIDLFD